VTPAFPLLLVLAPLVGLAGLALGAAARGGLGRWLGGGFALLPAVLGTWGALGGPVPAGEVRVPWLRAIRADFHLAVDGPTLLLAAVTALVTASVWAGIDFRSRGARARAALLLIAESATLAALASRDGFLLFACSELAAFALLAGAVLCREREAGPPVTGFAALHCGASALCCAALVGLRLEAGTSSLPVLAELARLGRLDGAHLPRGGALGGLEFVVWCPLFLGVACALRFLAAPLPLLWKDARGPADGRREAWQMAWAVLPALTAGALLLRVGLPLAGVHAQRASLGCALLGALSLPGIASWLARGDREALPPRTVAALAWGQLAACLLAAGTLAEASSRAAVLLLLHFGLTIPALAWALSLRPARSGLASLALLAALGPPLFSGAGPLAAALLGGLLGRAPLLHPLFLWIAPCAAVGWILLARAAWRARSPAPIGTAEHGAGAAESREGRAWIAAALLALSGAVGLVEGLAWILDGAAFAAWRIAP